MTNWTKHTGAERPAKLAPAQIIRQRLISPEIISPEQVDRADRLDWGSYGCSYLQYAPALDPDSLPYVSADGLEHWARYVATDAGGWGTYQFKRKPNWRSGVWRLEPEHSAIAGAPDTHAIPGPPENSLARVWRE